ncbi:MAG: dihydrodipicolinate synthase family protein [Planctomycetota bacterium]|nr:MAG: dihydrodipicolinate synthase family protein [Planctomycetota bacterium]GDY07105.1 4-hydroxy-tetrahydrodipicolinate synthase [Planctomycetia bacterium]
MTRRFGGMWPALVTPFGADGKPALDVVEQLVDLFAKQGMDGLYVTGSTGQWPLLTVDERQAIVERCVKASAGRIPIMAHVGAVATDDAVTLAKHAAKVGADAVSTVAPIYYSHSSDVVFEHYRRVGAAADLPLFVYHIDQAQKIAVGPQEYTERILALPNIAGMKITAGDLYLFGLIHSHAGDRLQLFSGADEVMCHAVLCGSIGAIGTFYNVFGPACRKAREAMVGGQVEKARSFMLAFQQVIARVIASGSIWSFFRAAMRHKYDIDIGAPRAPLGIMDKTWAEADVAELVALVDNAV